VIRIATWNVLAADYLRRDRYPRASERWFEPDWRQPQVAARALRLDADLLCLQEVDAGMWTLLQRALAHAGYAGDFAPKSGRTEGCALFWRRDRFEAIACERLVYADRHVAQADAVDSGHVAQLVRLKCGTRQLGVANTHLRWDPPARRGADHVGVRQARELIAQLQRDRAAPEASVVCGDFNAEAQSEVLVEFRRAAWRDAAETHTGPTFNATGPARRNDFIQYTPSLVWRACATPRIDADTILPGDDEPSDHVPVVADFDWA
jgi:mRNA deadenylase 3'-5' endonuclease subunit Ccr4